MSWTRSFGAVLVVSAVPAVVFAQTVPGSRVVARDAAAELGCGARSALVAPLQVLKVVGGFEPKKALFATGDRVTIDGGTAGGVQPGQIYFVRRVVQDRFTAPAADGLPIVSIHTAGWLRIMDAQANVSVGRVDLSCDGVEAGDYLEPFAMPAVPPSMPAGEPDFSAPGKIILGDERRQMGGAGSLMVLDRGSDHGLKPGQRLTIYRDTMDGRGPKARIGMATVMVVSPESSLIRIDTSTDAVEVGDLVAMHR